MATPEYLPGSNAHRYGPSRLPAGPTGGNHEGFTLGRQPNGLFALLLGVRATPAAWDRGHPALHSTSSPKQYNGQLFSRI